DFQASDFYDEHSLDLQRGYAIICKMVGHDQELFEDLAVESEFDDERQANCIVDFEKTEASWLSVMAPHIDSAQNSGLITVTHEEAADDDIAYAAEMLKDLGIMETWAESIDMDFVLPNPMIFRATSCGEPNAFYDPEVPEIVMCHELVALFADLIVEDIFSRE
ncbi:MAG: DUF4344 domain-containing metallopeptidase, partial [Alphaproteobacteria bacterium]